ncbi:gamma-glutamylcyclotransferase family protein [Evansella clarkii]|uniref:gamma-glutamylcyclotransferase family protein n=1 Tax=Evansella clarkii TaxID=79879 RepID=UPI001F4321CB|nr:gamma-glutamylcyclotransferase family protein [Evansella clarkii]
MMIAQMNVFVYGTLRTGEKYSHLLKDAERTASQAWINGSLYDTHCGYPALEAHPYDIAYGELYRVSTEELAMLDLLEGYEEGRRENLFFREKAVVNTDNGVREAYVYYLDHSRSEMKKEKISSGDWKLHKWLKQQPERLFYFAYGSCMDDERITSDGAAEHFNKDVLFGKLSGYSLCYSISSKDGGRADIREGEGSVEGILYTVRKEAVEYLFRREGVRAGRYRPAFVNVEADGRVIKNVLTFSVIEKKDDMRPPDHYALEILRGAKGRVSEEYYDQLKRQMEMLGVETEKLEKNILNNY